MNEGYILHVMTIIKRLKTILSKQNKQYCRHSDSKHEAILKEFYSKVLANGDIYRLDYEGLYCVSCEKYKEFYSRELAKLPMVTFTNLIMRDSIVLAVRSIRMRKNCLIIIVVQCPVHLKPRVSRE